VRLLDHALGPARITAVLGELVPRARDAARATPPGDAFDVVELAIDLDTETLIRYLDRFLMFYIRTADRLQRTSVWLESIEGGLDYVRSVVVDDSLGLGADLEADMAAHIGTYQDEWRATLDDEDKLSRFVSFINAPDTPDPSISFVTEREQIRPAEPGKSREPVLVASASIPVGAPR